MDYQDAEKILADVIAKLPANTYEAVVVSPYEYWGKIEKIVDGDTIDVSVSVGFNFFTHARIRLLGINTPEIHGIKQDSDEYRRGQEAMSFVSSLLHVGDWVELKIKHNIKEKYGRWIGLIYVDGKCLNSLLIQQGYFQEY